MLTLADRLQLLQSVAPAANVRASDDSSKDQSGRARLDFHGTRAVKFAYLDQLEPNGIPLRIYPADTLEQARVFYGSPARVQRTLGLRERGWSIEPNFHWGFVSRGLCWSRSSRTTDEYVSYWAQRIDHTCAIDRDDWERELDRLIADGIFSNTDRAQFASDFTHTQRRVAVPRPGLKLARFWRLEDADAPGFSEQLRAALTDALLAIGEEPLDTLR